MPWLLPKKFARQGSALGLAPSRCRGCDTRRVFTPNRVRPVPDRDGYRAPRMCPKSDLRRLTGRRADLRKHITATDPEQIGQRRAIGRATEGEVDRPSSLVDRVHVQRRHSSTASRLDGSKVCPASHEAPCARSGSLPDRGSMYWPRATSLRTFMSCLSSSALRSKNICRAGAVRPNQRRRTP